MKRFLNFFKSIKFRILLLIVLATILPAVCVCAILVNSYESRAILNRESEILGQAALVADQIQRSGYLDGDQSQSETIRAKIDLITTFYNGRIIIIDSNYKICYDTYNLDAHKTVISKEVMRAFKGESVKNYDKEYDYIEIVVPIVDNSASTPQINGALMVSASVDNILINQSYLQNTGIVAVLLICTMVLFLAVLGFLHMNKTLKKFYEQLTAIQNGYGRSELSLDDFTETTVIAEKFNDIMAKAKAMDESRQEFVSNVSHELKTPLTSMKVLADAINSMPDAPIEMYQEFMEDITGEIERETQIINDLLSLVKMDKSSADLNITSTNMNELLEQILKRLQPIADKQKVELVLESFRPVTAEVDQVKITLAFTNLIENAIKYNHDDGTGWVHVSLNADHQYFYVKVEDNGIGMPEESLEHIYERFYRVDKSHSREIGGTGLGLAITRNSILMHRGAIKVYSVLDEGTTFDVRIPLNYIS